MPWFSRSVVNITAKCNTHGCKWALSRPLANFMIKSKSFIGSDGLLSIEMVTLCAAVDEEDDKDNDDEEDEEDEEEEEREEVRGEEEAFSRRERR